MTGVIRKEDPKSRDTQRDEESCETMRLGLERCCHKSRIARNRQKLEDARKDSPLDLLEEVWPCQHLKFGLPISRAVKE